MSDQFAKESDLEEKTNICDFFVPLVFTRPLDKSVWLKGHAISYFSTKTNAVGTQNNCLRERGTQSLSGRVLDSNRGAAGLSLTSITALCP